MPIGGRGRGVEARWREGRLGGRGDMSCGPLRHMGPAGRAEICAAGAQRACLLCMLRGRAPWQCVAARRVHSVQRSAPAAPSKGRALATDQRAPHLQQL